MKKIQKLIAIISLVVFILVSGAVKVHAQGSDPGCDPLCNCYPNPPYTPCPIDGGLVALLVLGAAYGAKKVADHRKAESQAL